MSAREQYERVSAFAVRLRHAKAIGEHPWLRPPGPHDVQALVEGAAAAAQLEKDRDAINAALGMLSEQYGALDAAPSPPAPRPRRPQSAGSSGPPPLSVVPSRGA